MKPHPFQTNLLIEMNVFVVIVTHNGKQWCDRCLGSLQQSLAPVKVVVVDNASTEEGVSEFLKLDLDTLGERFKDYTDGKE